jgi:glycosyltransferase involved in cell wall biosynthesis
MIYRQKVMGEVADIPDIVISPSKFVQHVFSNAGYPREIIYNPHGHDLRWLGRYEGQRSSHIMRFGYMGQITTIKGVHILVKAFKDVESVGGVKLDLWGDIIKDQHYVSKLKSLIGKSEKIALRGRFERADIAQVLSEIDVLVVPSLWYENAPLVIAEAFAAKIPVIASNIGGMAEAVTHEKNGLLFEVGSVEDLAAQMRRILQEPGLLEKLRQGIEPVKTFTQEVNELEQIYQELVSR